MFNITVIIVDDSSIVRRMVKDSLTTKGLVVIGEAKDGKEAVDIVSKLKPDIVLLDCEMPVMDGIEALKQIIKNQPSQKVIMFSSKTTFGAKITIDALAIGAIDFLPKPQGGMIEVDKAIESLIIKIKVAMETKSQQVVPVKHDLLPRVKVDIPARDFELIAIGSSTGGVKAALDIISAFKKTFPPVVWVQHMPAGFTASFAERMAKASEMHFKEAADGDILQKGYGYLAPGGEQIKIVRKAGKLVISINKNGEKVSGHKPSVDSMMSSLAQVVRGPEVLGIILTGMGEDGSQGLKTLHDKGAFVIGQDESTCVVYGMPKVAKKLGAVDMEIKITEIPSVLNEIVKH